MNSLFSGCSLLSSLQLSNLNTSNVVDMQYMFSSCSRISSIELSNFDTSKVTSMDSMFYYCSSLTSLNLSNFVTSKVTDMDSMFRECISLSSLIVTSFNTSKVTDMYYMFYNCRELTSLDLSNFNTILAYDMRYLFQYCSKLEYINLENAIMNAYYYSYIFSSTSNQLIVCSKYRIWNDLLNGIENINCQNLYNFLQGNQFKCYQKNFINTQTNKNICGRCGLNYYKIYNDTKNNNTYTYCYKKPDGYYLDNSELIYKECYYTCKKCDREGNESFHNCLVCNDEYKNESIISNYLNCYNICSNYYYFDIILNKTFCTQEQICPDNYSKLIINKKECIDNCYKDPEYKFEYKGICYNKCPINTINNTYLCENIINEESQTNLIKIKSDSSQIKIITSEFALSENSDNKMSNSYENHLVDITEYYDNKIILNLSEFEIIKTKLLSNINTKEDVEAKLENTIITLTTTYNQKYNFYENKSTIDLMECEDKLKQNYNIPSNSSLYILKVDIDLVGMSIPKIEYAVYYPLYGGDLIKLNLSICEDTQIDISIPVAIKESIEKYNLSSDYYTDICSKETTDTGTDICLPDRKKIFIDNNMTLCEEDCKLTGYNFTTKKAKCSCLVKIDFPLIKEIKFDKEKLFNNFLNIKNNMNIKLIKCYHDVFNMKSLLKNYGFYIFIFIYVIFFICFLLFYCKYFISLKNVFNKISEIKDISLKNDIDKNEITGVKNVETINNKKQKKKEKEKNVEKKNDIINQKINKIIQPKKNKFVKVVFPINPPLKKYNNVIKKDINKEVTDISSMHKINVDKNNKASILNEDISIKPEDKKLLEYNDNELNSLLYEKAILYDKRTFVQYYVSLLKNKHLLIFSFYSNNNDYNSQIIKIFLFIFFFAVHFTVNALFFNDNTMHKI